MVHATPINLSYTIYPGEKFFDGQLVAIEENRLTFRKVIKPPRTVASAHVRQKVREDRFAIRRMRYFRMELQAI